MDDTAIDTADYVKFAGALVGLLACDLGVLGRSTVEGDGLEGALCRLGTVQLVLDEILTTLGSAAEAGHYSDGRAVLSHIETGDGTGYVYPWHPDPASPANKPHEIATVTTPNGGRRRIIVSASGYLDVVTFTVPEESHQ
jgi:hypothetical protein